MVQLQSQQQYCCHSDIIFSIIKEEMGSRKDVKDSAPFSDDDETIKKEAPIMTNGTHSTNSGPGTISKKHLDQERYPVSAGIAVVINNIEFNENLNLPDRKGSDVDASSLFQRFQELGFDSDLLNDASNEDMMEKFNEIKKDKKNLENTDCLIVALLTHGNEDHVFMTDMSVKIKTIMDLFNAESCKELILKPKIFIFQACRGSGLGHGVNMKVTRDPNQADAGAVYTEYDKTFGETIRIPNEADFLAVYSTSAGYGSFRNTEKGSPFVRHMSEELLKMKKDDDFYKILTRVNKRVGMGYKPNYPNSDNITQMPCFISHLTKDLYLKQMN
ncbi:caspase-3-like [Mytilus californianus]|uniref:caspase-3-like n=1 Tax=Mytilus californianus TaxID=6549 RepID=UPI00224771C8|nr:caspase-3-like [Mytilus californianus]